MGFSKLKIAGVSVGLQGHGHNLSFAPNAMITIIATIVRRFGDDVSCKVFDEVLLGYYGMLKDIEEFSPNVLLISVPVSGYYKDAIRLCQWAKERNISVLMGGYHFEIPRIAEISAKKRNVVVCYGDGEFTAIGFIDHIMDPEKTLLSDIPNLCFFDEKKVVRTKELKCNLGSQPYPSLPLKVFDPRKYWQTLGGADVHRSGHDLFDGISIGRTVVGPKVVTGCNYRSARLSVGKSSCSYCTLVKECASTTGERFWQLMSEMYNYIDSIPWDGDKGIRCYQIGDDMASNLRFIREIWESIPDWIKEVPLGQRAYAWYVWPKLAKMLHDIGMRWLYIGADGKKGFTSNWSSRHPLIKTLQTCREHNLSVSLGFVLGQRGQSWKDIEQWKRFCHRVVSEFGDVLIITDGWVNVIAPGSPDWDLLCNIDPSFRETDCPDLELARVVFWKNFTDLGDIDVRSKLYEMAKEFENDHHSRTFMIEE